MASIRKRGETFTITAYLGYDEMNRQIKKTTTYRPPEGVTAGKAEKLAKAFAAQWEDSIKGYVALDENRTFAELVEWYYKNVAPVILKPNVLQGHQNIIYTYVMPTLAHKKLKAITPAMLDALFMDLLKNGRKRESFKLREGIEIPKGISCPKYKDRLSVAKLSRDTGICETSIRNLANGKGIEKESAEKIARCLNMRFDEAFEPADMDRGLAETTVSRIKRALSGIFTQAVKKEIIRRNPVMNTVALKKTQPTDSFLDEQQAITLLAALDEQKDYQFKAMISTLLYTGMRGGELCGLQWQDIDFEHGIINIRHTLTTLRNVGQQRGMQAGKGSETVYLLQEPKTENSQRYIVMPASLVEILKEHKRLQDEKKAAIGGEWSCPDMVFTTLTGKYYPENYLNVKFKKLAQNIGLPDGIHLHSLRHTTASLLINADVPPKLIAEQLGHSSATITQDIYSHIFASSKARAAQVLDLKLNEQPTE